MTMDQVREAVLNSDFGARIADSSNFLQQIFRISDRSESTARAAEAPPARELASLAFATLTDSELRATLPETGSDWQEAASADAARLFTLRVGQTPTAEQAAQLATQKLITDSEPQQERTEAFSGGWVDTFMMYNERALFPEYTLDDASYGGLTAPASGAAGLASEASTGFHPRIDTLSLSGDFSAGFTLSALPADIGQIELAAGNDYVLAIDDDFVAAGQWLLVHGRAADSLMFDGSAESDGRFSIFGSGAGDFIFGGAGNDLITGLGGADVLSGGAGADVFAYYAASDSTGANYDVIADFDPAADRIDLPGTVAGFGAAIEGGSLSEASFDGDLAAALAGLGANQARWFAPDTGDLAGTIFLVVDGNGVAGYQAGQDYVFAIGGAPLADLTSHTAIFV